MTNLWVAVGGIRSATSIDTAEWTVETNVDGVSNVFSVAFGNNLWVAAGAYGIATSPDGVTWTSRTNQFTAAVAVAVDIAYGGGLWVAVGDQGIIATSPDGVTWTQRTSPFTQRILAIAYGDGLWIATGQEGIIATSPDGVTWTSHPSPTSSSVPAVAYGSGLWVVTSSGYTNGTAVSTDGNTWTQGAMAASHDSTLSGVAYGNGLWVVVGGSGGIYTSSNGVNWTTQSGPFAGTAIQAVGYGAGRWVAVGNAGHLATSNDGVSWAGQTSSFGTNQITAVAWSNTPPNAPSLNSPTGGVTVGVGQSHNFTATFSDTDVNAAQTAFQARYRVVGSPSWTVRNKVTGAISADTIPSGTFTSGSNYEWQARTWDDGGVVGPWSASGLFTGGSANSEPAITDPTNGQTITAGVYIVRWKSVDQAAYELRRVGDDGAGHAVTSIVYYDSGEVTSTVMAATIVFSINNRTEHIQLRVKDATGFWSSWADRRVVIAYTPPAIPTVTCTANPDATPPNIGITVANPTPTGSQPTVTSVDIYRRVLTDGGNGIRVVKGLTRGQAWNDYRAASQQVYQYQAVVNASSNSTSSASAWTP